MSFKPAKCPSCGGELRLPSDRQTAKCTYCGSDIIVQEAIDRASPPSAGLFALAESALSAGDFHAAADKFERYLEGDPTNPEAWYLRGMALLGKAGLNLSSKQVVPSLTRIVERG